MVSRVSKYLLIRLTDEQESTSLSNQHLRSLLEPDASRAPSPAETPGLWPGQGPHYAPATEPPGPGNPPQFPHSAKAESETTRPGSGCYRANASIPGTASAAAQPPCRNCSFEFRRERRTPPPRRLASVGARYLPDGCASFFDLSKNTETTWR